MKGWGSFKVLNFVRADSLFLYISVLLPFLSSVQAQFRGHTPMHGNECKTTNDPCFLLSLPCIIGGTAFPHQILMSDRARKTLPISFLSCSCNFGGASSSSSSSSSWIAMKAKLCLHDAWRQIGRDADVGFGKAGFPFRADCHAGSFSRCLRPTCEL